MLSSAALAQDDVPVAAEPVAAESVVSEQHFTAAGDRLPSDNVLSLAQTRDGFLWVGTDRGLARFDGRQWRVLDRSSHPTLSSEHISALTPDRDGYLWVGTKGGGLYRFNGANFLPISRPNQLGGPWNVTAVFQQDDGLLWVGTPEDLLYLQPLSSSLRYGLPGIPVSNLTIDPYDHVWASAGRGLFRQVQLTFQTLSLPLGVANRAIHCLVMTPGGQLILGREDGLMLAEGRFDNTGLPQSADLIPGLRGPVSALLIDQQGRLIVGTSEAVIRLGGALEPGLRPDSVQLITPDSARGDAGWRANQIIEDREGGLWIATTHGLHRIENTIAETTVNLTVTISADGRPRRPATRYLLPPETEILQIELAAPTFRQVGQVEVRSRLEGHDEGWRTGERSLTYQDLSPGTYSLTAEASLDGGATWTIEERVEIEIEPELLETWTFWLSIIGGFAGILGIVGGWLLFVRHRERRFAEMAAQEWREIQEESGMIDSEHDLGERRPD